MSDRTLINLLVPDQINDRMKSVCTDLGLTRTAFILTSIEPRIRLHESHQIHIALDTLKTLRLELVNDLTSEQKAKLNNMIDALNQDLNR